MKKLFLIACSILFALVVNTSSAEVSENWQWQLGDQFEEVATLVSRLPTKNCKKTKVKTYDDASLFAGVRDELTGGSIWKIKSKRQDFINLQSYEFDRDCNFIRGFNLYFCTSTGELAAIDKMIRIYPDKPHHRYKPFTQGDPAFIGFNSREHDLLFADFGSVNGYQFEVFHPKTKTIRYSFFKNPRRGFTTVSHLLFSPNNGDPFQQTFKLCPNGPKKFQASFQPKFHSLQDILKVYGFVARDHNQIKSNATKCAAWFPEREASFQNYWHQWQSINKPVIDLISAKVEQIVVLLDRQKFSDDFRRIRETTVNVVNIDKRDCDYFEDVDKIWDIRDEYIVSDVYDYLSMSKKAD